MRTRRCESLRIIGKTLFRCMDEHGHKGKHGNAYPPPGPIQWEKSSPKGETDAWIIREEELKKRVAGETAAAEKAKVPVPS